MKFPKVVGYELVQEIGGGGFSTVYRAAHIEQHRVAACKVIQLTPNTTEKERKTIEKEMRIHAALKHRNVLEFLNAVVVEPGHARYVSAFYILLEFAAGGDLFDKIVPDVGINEEVAQYYFNQLLNGMSYIHSQGVCHRDLKPENILLDVAGTLKISDFGLSAVYMLKESGKTRPLSERCGSLPYVAPELARDVPYQAQPVDAWGIGVMLFTMLSGNTPWDEPTAQSVEFRAYISGEIFDVNPWKKLSEDALSLICGLLTYNPEERMTLSEAGQHPWCIRPSQLGSRGPLELANRLIENLKNAGDLEFANPSVDSDGDSSMSDGTDPNSVSASHSSQFTQSLLLFTQSGTRYTPHLTRFYSSSGPSVLLTIISRVLERMNVKFKAAPTGEDAEGQGQGPGPFKLRIGGYDRRRVMFKGWVVVERFAYREVGGSFCVMQRDVGDPISWRRLWRDLIEAEEIGPSVLRK